MFRQKFPKTTTKCSRDVKEILGLLVAAYISLITMPRLSVIFAENALHSKSDNLMWAVPSCSPNQSPKIDGFVGDRGWAKAAAITGFIGTSDSITTGGVYDARAGVLAGGKTLAPLQPIAFLCYDNEAFYVAVKVPHPRGAPLVSNIKKRDGLVWNDDSIEFFISSNDNSYRHLVINVVNTRYDAIGRSNSSWDGNWLSATASGKDFWSVEVAVPWKDLGYPSPPSSVKFNIGWNCKTGTKGPYCWSPVESSYHETDKFVKLLLGTGNKALRLMDVSLMPNQNLHIGFNLVGDVQKPVKASLSRDGEVVTTCQSQKGQSELIVVPPKAGSAAKAGDYVLEYQCGDLANWRMGVHVSSPVSNINRLLAGFVDVSIDLSLLPAGAKPSKVNVALISDKTGQAVEQVQLEIDGKDCLTHTFDVKSFPVGRYTVEAVVLDRGGQKIATYYGTPINKLARTEWQGYKGGISDKVLSPWIPVEVSKENKVKVWGREYSIKNGIFPDEITSLGKEILYAPIMFKGTYDGVPLKWKNHVGKLVSHSSAKTSFEGGISSKNIQIKGTSVIEYDGMMKVDFDVIPVGEKGMVDLILEIPLKKQNAEYLYYFPVVPGSTTNAGALPLAGWSGPFKPYVWLGNNDFGLSWFCESSKGWHPADSNKALRVVRRGDDVVLQLDILNNVSLEKPRHYTFGFQATPVKSPEKDAWDYRILRVFGQDHVRLYAEDPKHIEQLASLGVRTIVFHENWTDIQCSNIPSNPQGLRNLIKNCHKNGIQILLYFGSELSELSPYWDLSHAECVQVSFDKDLPYAGPAIWKRKVPKQDCWRVCYKSPWVDYVAWTVAKCMDEYDIDGVYLDGTAFPFPCGNNAHGCGYIGEDGKRHDEYNIFPVRALVKRLYTIVKSRKPDGQINIHNSGDMVTPTVGWATSAWDGEQIRVDFKKVGLGTLRLDTFRAEMMGKQWGIPSEFLAYTSYAPGNDRAALAITLLHDVIVRLDDNHALAGQLWDAMDTFGRKQALFMPYWSNGNFVRTTSNDVKVSLYNRKEKGVLLVISNLSKTEKSVTVILDTQNLQLGEGPFTAIDMITHKPVEILENGRISLRMNGMTWRLIKVEAKK